MTWRDQKATVEDLIVGPGETEIIDSYSSRHFFHSPRFSPHCIIFLEAFCIDSSIVSIYWLLFVTFTARSYLIDKSEVLRK